jgi:hypothetical protein
VPKVADLDNYYLVEDQTVRESFQQVYDNTRNLQDQADTQSGQMVVLDEKVVTVSDAVGTLESDIEELQPLKDLPPLIEALDARLVTVEAEVASNTQVLTTLPSRVETLEGQITPLATLPSTVSALQATVSALAQRVTALESAPPPSGGDSGGGSGGDSGGGSGGGDTTDPGTIDPGGTDEWSPLPPDLIA